jgi:thiamine biosynthesis lipoprotein
MSTPISASRRTALAAGFGSFALVAAGCSERRGILALPDAGAKTFHGLAMGSSYTVKIASALPDATLADATRAVADALEGVVALMSHYEPQSEVSRLNRQPPGTPLAVSASTLRVFQLARQVQLASDGAFDIGVGRAVDEWGFGPSARPQAIPSSVAIQGLRSGLRPDAFTLDAAAGTLTRHAPVWANLSGIAKGYGVDAAASALDALGIADYMVEVGGEIRARGRNSAGRPWQIAIERPDAMPRRALRIVPLDGRSLATSGDYRNYFVHEGRRYSHEIDPGSAAPVTHALASVSVVADDCTLADAWSTALFVLGPERGYEAAMHHALAAHFVMRRPDGTFGERQTAGFRALGSQSAVG